MPEYMRVKEIFSFENIARMHREIEQLKDVVREMSSFQIPQLQAENSELKKENAEMKNIIIEFIKDKRLK